MSLTGSSNRHPLGRDELDRIVREHRLWLESDQVEGVRAALNRTDLSSADLAGADLSRGDLSGARLTRANLAGCNLTAANLVQADVSWANLCEANL